jgi:hypothetical protein
MQDLNAATITHASSGACQEPMMDQMTMMCSAHTTPWSPPPFFPFFPFTPMFGLILQMHMHLEDLPVLLGSFQAPDAHLDAAITAAP